MQPYFFRVFVGSRNILICIATDKLSGPARQLLQLFDYVDREEYRLILASTWRGGRVQADFSKDDFFRELINRGVPLYILQQKLQFDPLLLWQAHKIVKREEIHIVQTHSYKATVIGFFLKYVARVPWIAFMHGETREDIKVRIYQDAVFRLMRFADRVVTVSNEMRARFISKYMY